MDIKLISLIFAYRLTLNNLTATIMKTFYNLSVYFWSAINGKIISLNYSGLILDEVDFTLINWDETNLPFKGFTIDQI